MKKKIFCPVLTRLCKYNLFRNVYPKATERRYRDEMLGTAYEKRWTVGVCEGDYFSTSKAEYGMVGGTLPVSRRWRGVLTLSTTRRVVGVTASIPDSKPGD